MAGALAVLVPATGVEAQTSDLAKPQSSVEIVLASSSKAMGRARLTAVRRAIAQAVHALPAGTPVTVQLHGTKSKSCLTANGQRTMVLIAGGQDTCAPPPQCLTSASPFVRVDVIGLQVNAAGRRVLQCTARASGGIYRDAATPAALLPELEAALGRATRDRRPLGTPVAGGLEQSQATPVAAGEYLDSIAPDSERWYRVAVPPGHVLTAAATLVAPPSVDVSAPGSSLTLDAFGGALQTDTASNLFAFDPSRTVTVSVSSKSGNSVRVALHDSPDKQLAQKLHGRSLALELLFRLPPVAVTKPPASRPVVHRSAHDVSWGAAIAGLVVCALIAFATAGFARRRATVEEKS